MCAEVTWGDFRSLCQRNNRGGSGDALQVGQGGCALWMGSWSRAELGNMFPSQGALLGDMLPTFLVRRQDQDPREDKQRLSQAGCWQGELSAMQRLPLLT